MILLILGIIIIILLILLTFVWPPDSPWSPWWRTDKNTARVACKLAGVSKKDIVYELGSGDGEFILMASREFGAKATGIEIDYTRYWISMIRKKIWEIRGMREIGGVKFVRKDFKKVNLSDATVVYFYLVPAVIKGIMPKLKKELRPGTKIISYRYEVPLPLSKKDKKNKMYLYKI